MLSSLVAWATLFLSLSKALQTLGLDVSDACPYNSVNYAGEYIFVAGPGLIYSNGSVQDSVPNGGFSTRYLILPGDATNSYVVKKLALPYPEDTDGATNSSFIDDRPQDFENIPVVTMCVAPPYPGAGLECVDLEDVGITRLTPLEVDEDCNMLKSWYLYMEPTLPDCTRPFCSLVAYGTYTLVNSSSSEADSPSKGPD
eukprot:jgi/Picsp_1/1223/NSC_04704-R1_---NA---